MSTCSGTAKSSVLIPCIVSKTPLLLVSGTAPSLGFKIFAGTALQLVSALSTKVHCKTEFAMQGKEQRYSRMHGNYSKPYNRSLNLSFSSEMCVLPGKAASIYKGMALQPQFHLQPASCTLNYCGEEAPTAGYFGHERAI